ncbi:restriction endonuclease [Enterococcus sp. BWM-S5]|uniref:Restriction endonuclease n=1 Tax=Enterococcus larvae TaxID=2794352 RepID=A0ABS4CM46_9ENTE|nr:PmeII family type II restriction endonuclease [Enterococcus larvae]MBP1047563.1 restriction endonuclease [Enterococcus larvae]
MIDPTNNDEIIVKAKEFFREVIGENHIKNTKKLSNINNFNVNPFLNKYLANFLTGNDSPESIAKALIYPRVLGTSITTSFGSNLQKFINTTLEGYGSTTSGIDIEFIDKIDNRKKYCQIKAGPQTINYDDVTTIENHFKKAINLGRTNGVPIANMDCVVGVFYGEQNELSQFYKTINQNYTVLIGKEFWFHLTGDEDFYNKITDAIGEIANEFDGRDLLELTTKELAKKLKEIDTLE